MLKSTKYIYKSCYAILLLGIAATRSFISLLITMIAAFLIMVENLETILKRKIMAFFKSTLDKTYVFISFLLHIIDEKPQYAFMI